MLNVEMPRADATPKEALAAIQERIQRQNTTREPKQASPIRKSSRIESASAASSPARKEKSPAVKKSKRAATKKSQQQLLLDGEDSEGEGKAEDVPEAEAENPPDYKDRVVSTTNSDNRPSIGKVGKYIAEKKGLWNYV